MKAPFPHRFASLRVCARPALAGMMAAVLSVPFLPGPDKARASSAPPAASALMTGSSADDEKKVRFWIRKKKRDGDGAERSFPQFDMMTRANLLMLNEKLDEALGKVERGEYHLALQQLEVDVLRRTDGCARDGKPDPDDLITDCAAQQEIYPLVVETIAMIKALQ